MQIGADARRIGPVPTAYPALARFAAGAALVASITTLAAQPPPDRGAERWVAQTLAAMTVDAKVGQLLMAQVASTYIGTDSGEFERASAFIRDQHVGGFVVSGGAEAAPNVLLNTAYGTVTLGQPLEAASIVNRLQAQSKIPLLVAADFEGGVGFRIAGATLFPKAMAFGAAGDEQLAYRAATMSAREARALGVHLHFAPVADVNNNPRNPVINTRSYGADPARVGAFVSAWVRGLAAGGAMATLKHFPGHGDTDTDTHLGFATVAHPRTHLDEVELVPFRAAIAAKADAVMSAHLGLSAVDDSGNPATLSKPVIDGLLRHELRFDGLVVTDSMGMAGVTSKASAGEAAVRAIEAGNDIVLNSPDQAAAFRGLRQAVDSGRIATARLDASVTRILRAKARLGLHRAKLVDLSELPKHVGTRSAATIADDVGARAVTLVKDDRNSVPLRLPREASILFLSIVDYPAGWRIASPSRAFQPELRQRWPNTTAIELSDRATREEIELVRAMAPRYDAIVAAVYVRASSASGRSNLPAPLADVLTQLATGTKASNTPFVAAFFGSPYAAAVVPDVPAILLTYDLYDRAERSAVRTIAGEAKIGGRLPVPLPGLAELGAGLDR
jgi:beta-N-acetylhexosaminidase